MKKSEINKHIKNVYKWRQKIQNREKNKTMVKTKESSMKETNKRANVLVQVVKQTREASSSETLTFMCQSARRHIPQEPSLRGKWCRYCMTVNRQQPKDCSVDDVIYSLDWACACTSRFTSKELQALRQFNKKKDKGTHSCPHETNTEPPQTNRLA